MSSCIKLTIYRGVPWDECLGSVHQPSVQSASDKPERRNREEEGGAFLSITLTDLEAQILFPLLFLVIWNPPSQQYSHYTCEIHHHSHHFMCMKGKKWYCSNRSAASSASNNAPEKQILGWTFRYYIERSWVISQSICKRWIIIVDQRDTKKKLSSIFSVDKLNIKQQNKLKKESRQ